MMLSLRAMPRVCNCRKACRIGLMIAKTLFLT
jgi:hypothetical protein